MIYGGYQEYLWNMAEGTEALQEAKCVLRDHLQRVAIAKQLHITA